MFRLSSIGWGVPAGALFWMSLGLGGMIEAHAQAKEEDAVRAAGEQVYNAYCAICHQPSGAGDGEYFPPLVRSEWVTGDKDRLIRIVLGGVTGPIMVDGTEYDSAMAGFQEILDDEQIAAVATYIRNAWGNSASRVDPADVAAVRAASADRTTPWTVRELLTAPAARD